MIWQKNLSTDQRVVYIEYTSCVDRTCPQLYILRTSTESADLHCNPLVPWSMYIVLLRLYVHKSDDTVAIWPLPLPPQNTYVFHIGKICVLNIILQIKLLHPHLGRHITVGLNDDLCLWKEKTSNNILIWFFIKIN